MATPTNLWDKAFQSLNPDLQATLGATHTPKRNVLSAVLRVAEEKRATALRKSWKYTKRSGEVIFVRDLLEKIVDWVQRFKATGDTIVQYDPAHAALPWAAVRFLLQVAVSEVELFGALVDDLEYIARMMVRYRAFETIYLRGTQSEMEKTLGDCLVRLYAEVLTHLSYAVAFFEENTLKRLLKSPFRSIDLEREKIMHAREKEVNEFAKLVDAETIQACEATFTRLSIQATKDVTEEKYDSIVKWLSIARYRDHHQLLAQSRLPDAGQWLLRHPEYLKWKDSSACSLILIHGIPGAGKSTLSSVVVDALLGAAASTPDLAPFGYFYCANPESEKARRSSDDIMRTILFQLAVDATNKHKLREFLCDEYDRQVLMARAGTVDLVTLTTKDCVRLILELAQQDPVTIILDGLDSVDDNERCILIAALRDIVSKADNIVKVFVTSRTSGRAAAVPDAEYRIQITEQETKTDMEVFVDHLIDGAVQSKRLLEGNLGSQARAMLRKGLLAGAGEMFLWAKLQLELVVHETVEDDVLTVLQNEVPQDLDQLYHDFLGRILSLGPLARNLATKVFSWILFMREPLTTAALLAALATGEEPPCTMTQVMATCSAFIIIDNTSDVLRFAHQSAQDFLTRHPTFTITEAHCILANACIEACLRGSKVVANASVPFCLPISNFSHYAALYWSFHAETSLKIDASVKNTTAAERITRSIQSFIFDEDWDLTWPFEHWVKRGKALALSLPRDHSLIPFLEAIPEADSGGLFLLSMLGLNDILAAAVSCNDGVGVNDTNESGHTPVYLAASFGHADTIELLVRHGANVNVEGGSYGSPLHVACFRGHLAAVKQLLGSGAQHSCGSVFKHAVEAAFRGNREDVALYLLSQSSTVEGNDYDEAMWEASSKGFLSVVQHLQRLQTSAPTKNKSEKTRQRIRKSIQTGDEAALQSLLHFSGLDANIADSLPPDSIALATLHNRKAMVEFLIEQGMSLEAEGVLGSPLRTASLLNFRSIVLLLLARGAKADAIGKFGDALQAAASNGHTAIMKLLIQEGVSADHVSGYFRLPIQAAAYYGHLAAVEALLDANASVERAGLFRNALEAAAKGGNYDIIELISRKRPSPDRQMMQRPVLQRSASSNPRHELILRAAVSDRSRPKQPDNLHRKAAGTSHMNMMPIVDTTSIFRNLIAESEVTGLCADDQRSPTILPENCNPGDTEWSRLLIGAASSGYSETIVWLLKHNRDELATSETTIGLAITAAAKNGHLSVLGRILEFLACVPNNEALESFDGALLAVDIALEILSEHCTEKDYFALSDRFCTVADKYCQQVVGRDDMLQDFAVICRTGNIKLARSILESSHHELLLTDDVDGGLQLCARHNKTELATFLLTSPALQRVLPLSGEEAFVAAAANGSTEIMVVFTQHWKDLQFCQTALGRALAVASEHGQISVVRYLVLDLAADVNALSPDVGFAAMLANAGCSIRRERRHPFIKKPTNMAIERFKPASTNSAYSFFPPLFKHIRESLISPLQAALSGFALRFGPQENIPRRFKSNDLCRRAASQEDQERVIKFLLDRGCNPDDLGGQGTAPIQTAVMACSPLTVDLLIEAGANVNESSLLHEAAAREHPGLSILHRLLAAGARIPDDAGELGELIGRPLGYFSKSVYRGSVPTAAEIFSNGPGACLLFLLSQTSQLRTTDERWSPILQIAVCLDDHQAVDLLLSRGTDVNSLASYHGTALQAAARYGHFEMVQKLLNAGANVNQIGGADLTALRAALSDGHDDVVRLLLRHGADPRMDLGSRGDVVHGALQLAVQTNSLAIAMELLTLDANLLHDVKPGTTHPLIYAVNENALSMVVLLLSAGAPVNVHGEPEHRVWGISAQEASPIHAACHRGYANVLELLLQYGADFELEIGDLGTPLAVAACEGHVNIIQNLLSVGAKGTDKKALTGALRAGKSDAVQLLLASGANADIDDFSLACQLHTSDVVDSLLSQPQDVIIRETMLNKAYSTKGLSGQITRVLLEYSSPTMSQFLNACASGSAACVELMLHEDSIDINELAESSGIYPLQAAALHLQVEVTSVLVRHGANTECQTSSRENPLLLSLEACAAPILQILQERDRNQTAGTKTTPEGVKNLWRIGKAPEQDIRKCRRIMEELVPRSSRPLQCESLIGPPLHLACLIGDESIVKLLLNHGEDQFKMAGHFGNGLMAAIQGGSLKTIGLLLHSASAPQLRQVHPEYGTALHFASCLRNEKAVRLLLRHGADATIRDTRNRTPLTVAIQDELSPDPGRGKSSTPFQVLLDEAEHLVVSFEDLLTAADLDIRTRSRGGKSLTNLLILDKCSLATEHHSTVQVLGSVLENRPGTDITPDLVSYILRQGKPAALALLDLMQRHGKRVKFTAEIRKAVDVVFDLESDSNRKQQFYGLDLPIPDLFRNPHPFFGSHTFLGPT